MKIDWREMRAVLAAFAANLGIALIKFIAFLLTHSASMLAESVHSVADTGNQVLLIVGRGRSVRPPSEEHPFGFGRERYFYGFVVSVMLFTVGAAFSIYDGIHKIINPAPVENAAIAFGVLGVSAVMEGFSLRTGIKEANHARGDRSWSTFIRKTKAPELPVVLLEDTAALIGLVFAFCGVGLAVLTGDGRWDGAGSLGIGVLLAVAAAILAVEMKSLLIGESASPEVQRTIIAALEDGPGAVGVIHMRTVHISPESLLVAAKIAIRETDSAAQVASAIDAAEKRARAAVPIALTIYLEPDLYRPAKADQTDPSIRTVLRGRARNREQPPGNRKEGPEPRETSLAAGQHAQRALLLEVKRPAGSGREAAEPAAEIGHGRAHLRLGQHAEAERQRGGTDVVPPLDLQRGGHGGQVGLGELPVRRGPGQPVPDLRQQPQFLPVAEHAGRGAEPPGGLRDTHDLDFNNLPLRKQLWRCQTRSSSRSV